MIIYYHLIVTFDSKQNNSITVFCLGYQDLDVISENSVELQI